MNLRQHRFVTEYLRHRDAMTAYSIAYNYQTSDYASLQSLANRLMNHPEVDAAIHSILDGIRHDVEQEIRAELKVELLTIQRKREILAKIAAGEFYAVHNYKGKDCSMCSQHVWPTINQVLKAIDLDNKMAGLYSVDKRQATPYPPKAETQNAIYSQQLSETVSLQPIEKTSILQQNTTIENSKAPLGVGVQQITTIEKEKAPLGVGVQQITTNKEVPLLDKEGTLESASRHELTGEVDSRTEKPQQLEKQQITTIPEEQLSPAGGDVRRTEVERSQSEKITTNHNKRQQKSPLPGRGLGEALLP